MAKTALIAKIPSQPGKRDDIIAGFAPMIEQVNAEAGTEIYIIHTDPNDENMVWVYELYTDDDAQAAHAGSEVMAALFGTIGEFVGGAPELISLAPISGKGL